MSKIKIITLDLKTATLSLALIIGIIGFFHNVNAAEKLPESVKTCLAGKLGDAVYQAILNGDRQATEAEKETAKDCFAGMIKKDDRAKERVTSDVKGCIKKAIGKELSELESAPTSEQEAKISQCFAGRKKGAIEFPGESKACIISIVGKERAGQILSGADPTAAEKNKIGPKCFGMKGPSGGEERMKDVPAESKSCIQGIIGNLKGEPNEAQKKQIGEKCFGGAERDKAKEGMKRELSNSEKSCFSSVIGKPMDQAGPLTADQEKLVGERCFTKTVEQATREETARRTSDMSDAQKNCVRERLGRSIEEIGQPNSEQEAVIGECRTGNSNTPAQNQGSAPAAANPTGVVPESQQTCSGNPFASNKPETQACIAERLGLTVATLCQGNYRDPNVEIVVMTCKTNNGE